MILSWSWRSLRGSDSFSGHRYFLPLWVFVFLLLGSCGFERQPTEEAMGPDSASGGPEAEIEAMLLASATSWNGGDLDGFMDDYRRSADLTFSGGTGVTRGWEDLRTRYLETYWAPDAVRDSLRFEGIEVVELGDQHALALGQYVLFRPEEDGAVTSSGFFSLVLQRVDGRWEILHDHTSATPEDDAPELEGS
jgi:ketosteroid isomerase-like protein